MRWVTLEAVELPPGEKALVSLQLPEQFIILFEPVAHSATFIEVGGEATRERRELSAVFNRVQAPTGKHNMQPGPLRLTLENRTDTRVLPILTGGKHERGRAREPRQHARSEREEARRIGEIDQGHGRRALWR